MLKKLKRILKEKIQTELNYNYVVPDLWNSWGYTGKEAIHTDWGELIVNPYNFYYDIIHSYILPKADASIDYNQSLSQLTQSLSSNKASHGGDWIKQSVVYSMMIRTSTSWDHDRSGDLEASNLYQLKETGTFVKSLTLLPLLKKMGVNTVYMLPISKFSLRDKKGDLGSPYAVCNFYELDPNLKDPMTGDEMTVEEEFQAFVEACHILGMRVVFDIIPRTNSVESDLILEHPEWFYWIHADQLSTYHPPRVKNLGGTLTPEKQYLPDVYKSDDVWKHIQKFSFAPNVIDNERWKNVLKKYQQEPSSSILDLIEKEFNLIIAPAFSDHINDTQPPWTDVTFFRLYLDHPLESQKYLNNQDLPPYILFDTIKANLHKGNIINVELWDTLANIIPYYQKKYGIDGARIDMGHALPAELIKKIISTARINDPDFCFIAEELEEKNAQKAFDTGYNMIISDGFIREPRLQTHEAHHFMYESRHLPCPVFAAGETHDTPRLAAREGGRTLSKMFTIMNMFMPNSVPFINSGQEIYELQPMNTGLDCTEQDLYRLPKNDRYYGKLALFDKYALHYLNADRWDLTNTLATLSKIRQQHLNTFTNPQHFVGLGFNQLSDPAIGFGYIQEDRYGWQNNNVFILVASTDMYHPIEVTVHLNELRQKSGNIWCTGELLYSSHEAKKKIQEFNEYQDLYLSLQPGEVKIIKL